MEREGDNTGEAPSGGDGAVVRATEPGAVVVPVPVGAEEIGSSLGEGPVSTVESGGDGDGDGNDRAVVMPMDRTEAIEGFVISTASDGAAVSDLTSKGGSVATVEENTGDVRMEECRTVEGECRTVEEESRTVEVSAGGGDTVMGECHTTERERLIEMEIGGLDVSMERRAMEERGTLASATPPEFPFTPSDMPIETESKGAEDEDVEAVARRLTRGKSVVGESDGQEHPRDLSAHLVEAPLLASVLASEEVFHEAKREEEERQRAREGPQVTSVQEVEVVAKERAAFREASYVPCVHFFVPFGVDAFVPRQSLQEEQVLHDPGNHLGMSGPLAFEVLGMYGPENTYGNPRVLPRALRRAPKYCKSSKFQGNLREFHLFLDRMFGEGRVTRQSLGLTEFRVPVGVPLFMLRTGDYTREEIKRHTRPVEDLIAYLSPLLDYAGYRERYLAYCLRMEERLSGALGGDESEAATGASGSRGSKRGGASSRRRVVSVVTREGIEGKIAIPSRSASITLPEAEVPRAWVENVYRLLLDCFTVIRQGAMGVSPEVLPRGSTAAAQRGGARRRSSSSGLTGRGGGREESSIREGGQGEATSHGRGVWTVKGSDFASLNGLRDLFPKRPWGARVTIPRDPYPSVLLPQDYENWLIHVWRQELDGMRTDLRHNFAYAPR
ncbi:hypothetical protein RHSIM_Rhsim01G0084500 [Rhododendron simsii]|uniref:Uncharacterized protein n=1 Tax=Rhododendron simsii TaxID=118357 RepID=A0A834LYX9_RHOSS|nr:hypothetical protein RHSIM_Rhsim01G0084500 [Rhododendron simsii]